MKKWQCTNCGKDVDHLIFDGYHIAEKLLEGMNFKVQRNDDGTWIATLKDDDDEAYFGQLNREMWLAEAESYASEIDVMQCPECGWDICPEADEVDL